jgi:hypothetical protein
MRTWNDTTWPGYGKVGDFFIRSSAESNGLNIIKSDGVGTEDYVRFFAGRDSNGYISDMFIQGSGLTRGYVGISTEDPQEKLHVSGNTIISGTLNIGTIGGGTPLINLGLDVTGTVVTGTTGGGTFTGGTVNGATNFTNGLTANTMSASTLFVNGVQITGDTFVTGGTYSAGTITFTNNQNGQFPVTGLTEPFTGGSGNCIADLYVTNIHGCSPITIYDSIKSTGSTVLGQTSISFGFQTSATTDYSHAEGSQTLASGQGSHAEGSQTSATTIYSHTEGVGTITLGDYSHSEGWYNISSGFASHSEGNITTSSGNYSHSEGSFTDSSGFSSHAEGGSSQSIGDYSHAEGVNTIVSIFGAYAHAEGAYTLATGQGSHSEGYYTTTNGYYSHAEGTGTTANGFASHSEGDNTIAYEDFQKVMGKYNTTGNTNQLFIIGRGTSISRANALRVSSNGNLNIAGTLTQSSADYAEYFESIDGNSYPYGTVVELENDKIKICTNADNAIGVISSKPAIVGNADDGTEDEWVGKYEKDIWGNFITEDYTYQVPIGLDSENNTIYKTVTDKRQKINKNYDETRTYIPRSERPEWNVVGLLGQIRVLKNQQIPNRWIKMKDINDDIAIYLVR